MSKSRDIPESILNEIYDEIDVNFSDVNAHAKTLTNAGRVFVKIHGSAVNTDEYQSFSKHNPINQKTFDELFTKDIFLQNIDQYDQYRINDTKNAAKNENEDNDLAWERRKKELINLTASQIALGAMIKHPSFFNSKKRNYNALKAELKGKAQEYAQLKVKLFQAYTNLKTACKPSKQTTFSELKLAGEAVLKSAKKYEPKLRHSSENLNKLIQQVNGTAELINNPFDTVIQNNHKKKY